VARCEKAETGYARAAIISAALRGFEGTRYEKKVQRMLEAAKAESGR
jgi:hypothetical protein